MLRFWTDSGFTVLGARDTHLRLLRSDKHDYSYKFSHVSYYGISIRSVQPKNEKEPPDNGLAINRRLTPSGSLECRQLTAGGLVSHSRRSWLRPNAQTSNCSLSRRSTGASLR